MTPASMRVSDVLRGAYDIHVHGYPEGRADADHVADDIDAARLAAELGMSGCVLKSHFWPTMGRAYHINRSVPGFEALPSITLNSLVGGISPAVAEMAILQGARAIWLPTWSATNDRARGGLSARLPKIFPRASEIVPEGGLQAVKNGEVGPEVKEVLRVAAEAGIAVGTGHLSGAEGVAIAREADRIGFRQLVFTHPWSNSVGATHEQIRAAAELGAWIEMTFVGMLPARQYVAPRNVEEVIELAGVEQCILSTDGGYDTWSSPAPTLMSLCAGNLMYAGISGQAIRTMIVDNPRKLLGLEAHAGAPLAVEGSSPNGAAESAERV